MPIWGWAKCWSIQLHPDLSIAGPEVCRYAAFQFRKLRYAGVLCVVPNKTEFSDKPSRDIDLLTVPTPENTVKTSRIIKDYQEIPLLLDVGSVRAPFGCYWDNEVYTINHPPPPVFFFFFPLFFFSANRVFFGLFCFISFPISPPPPQRSVLWVHC